MLGLGRAALGLDPTYVARPRFTAMIDGFPIAQAWRDV
jgi:hypothetical protein